VSPTPPSAASIRHPLPYAWTWRYFWAGLKDYLQARFEGKEEPALAKRKRSSLVVSAVLTYVLLGLVAAAILAGAGGLARLSGAHGSDVMSAAGSLGIAAGAVLMFVVLPWVGVRRVLQFARAMALRGWALENERLARGPITLPAP